ncbi:uncharacterized protein LOC142225273 [Haematobia irritans]|uniref:uncharacterized protein LOC142225273 n=1 Tax=Haematobia irritans TaxID=7368 RepID=UPI003F506381
MSVLTDIVDNEHLGFLDITTKEIEFFYEEVEDLLKMTKPHEITIIQGDFNAKVGRERVPGITGIYGLGERNERGDRLIQFCQERKMNITNTMFCLPPRRLYTWKSPQDRRGHIVRNQIDFILINSRYGSSVLKTSTYPGADVPSDHNLLMMKLRTKISVIKQRKFRKKFDIAKLNDAAFKTNIKERINQELNAINRETVEDIWNDVKNKLKPIAEDALGYYKRSRNKEWMTQDILNLMDQRRKYKNVNYELYWELNREIQASIRIAKNEYFKAQCLEIERLQKLHDDFNLYRKLKETAGAHRKTSSTVLYNSNNKPVFDIDEKKILWREYIKEVFTDDNRSIFEQHNQQSLSGTAISRIEVESAIKSLKDKKACGPDEIPSEILKLIDSENMDLLTKLFNNIYDTGQYPQEWLKSTFITIPKKNHAKFCHEFRLISLMSHALKIFLRIIHSRIYPKCENVMGTSQFGFREGMGTREALFSIQTLIQKCRNAQKDVFLCFIDYEKAFDNVLHDRLIDILNAINIEQKEIQCIKSLYWHQTAQVEINGYMTESIPISKGVRQGCILSPLLFNIYSEQIFRESVNSIRNGIVVSRSVLNNIRYADDTTLMTHSISQLQSLVDTLATCSKKYGLKINIQKTKFMIISKKQEYKNAVLKIQNSNVERVKSFKYLGATITDQWDSSKEIRCRIELARDAFLKYKKVFVSHDINLETKIRFVKAYVWSVLLYAMEVWTIKSTDTKKLEAFEIWIYRRILKIPWTAHVSNAEVLRKMHCERELIAAIKRRKTAYLGHIMRNQKYKLLQNITRIKIEGKPIRGRKELTWLDNITEWTGIRDVTNLLSMARNRERFADLLETL